MKPYSILVLAISVALTGCASMKDSVLFGAGVGGAAGSGIGVAAEPSVGSALIGLAVGGVIGGAMGYLGHKGQKKNPLLKKSPKLNVKANLPTLLSPEASCTELDEKIEGNHYFGPQVKCTIENPAAWSSK